MNPAYVGVQQRSLQSAVIHRLETDYGLLGSRRVLAMMATDVVALVSQFQPAQPTVSPGWLVFTGTKVTGQKGVPGKSAGDYPLVTLAWPVILPEDVQDFQNLAPGLAGKLQRTQRLKTRLQRLIEFGLNHAQGPVTLTTADLALMLGCHPSYITYLLQQMRQDTGLSLLTKGYFFDQGVRPSHKAEIITYYEQGMDEADIAHHSNHAPSSVGRYLRDYERVKRLLSHHFFPDQIASMIDMTPAVVKDYVNLTRQYHPHLIAHLDPDPPVPVSGS